jgi:hypothetical protein
VWNSCTYHRQVFEISHGWRDFFFISIFCRFSCSSYHKCTYWLCQMVVLLIIDYLNFPRDYFIFSIFGFWSFTKIERWTFLDMSLYFSGNRVVLLAAVSQNCSEKTIKFYVNTLYFPFSACTSSSYCLYFLESLVVLPRRW